MEEANKKKSYKIPVIAGVILTALVVLICGIYLYRRNSAENLFRSPAGIMEGTDGKIYVADSGNNIVLCMDGSKKEVTAGYTLPADMHERPAGGYQDGDAKEALFNHPFDLVEWYGGIAVSDTDNNCIRLITEDGKVRTLAGTGEEGHDDGYASEASFSGPAGMAVGSDGKLYIADSGSGTIRVISEDGEVTTLTAGLDTPMGLCADGDILYITDIGSNQVLACENGTLRVVAGIPYTDEDIAMEDGDASEATFSKPCGVYAQDGVLYVADTGFSAVRKIEDGKVTTLKQFEGTGTDLWPAEPLGIEKVDDTLYVTDAFTGVVFTLKIDSE